LNITTTDAGPFEKLVTLQIAEDRLEQAKNAAARKLSKDLKIPGFRPGRAPRKVVEATVGSDRLRAEAIDELLPTIVTEMLDETGLEPAVVPAVEQLRDTEEGIEIEVKVTLWPTVDTPPPYDGREFEITAPEVTDGDVQQQIDRMRDQFAELETVQRPAIEGDYVTVNLSATQNGVAVEEATASDLLYEVGSGSFLEGLDPHLTGKSAGDIVRFQAPLPSGFGERAGEEVTFQVLAKEVKQKKLPELTDDWASDFTEFDTVDELVAALRERVVAVRRNAVTNEFQVKILDDLIGELDVTAPEAIIDAEMESVFHSFSHRLEGQGITLNDYFRVTGQDQEQFVSDLRSQAERNVYTNVLLDAIAADRELVVEDAEYDELVEALASQAEEAASRLAERLAETNQEKELRSDILRRKALNALLKAAVPVDSEGRPIDLGLQTPDEEETDEPAEVADDV
jgi:trigger factor